MCLSSDDDVIQDRDIEEEASAHGLAREDDVLGRRISGPGWVVMDQDQVARVAPYRLPEELGYPDLAGIDGPDVELYLGDYPVLRIQ